MHVPPIAVTGRTLRAIVDERLLIWVCGLVFECVFGSSCEHCCVSRTSQEARGGGAVIPNCLLPPNCLSTLSGVWPADRARTDALPICLI